MSIVNITKQNFEDEILNSTKTVLLDFWAKWCGPCRMVSPVLDEISQETPSVKICKVNIDEEPELTTQFDVMSIPTLVVMKEGQIVHKSAGARPKSAILSVIQSAI